jgi:hypothetical protein
VTLDTVLSRIFLGVGVDTLGDRICGVMWKGSGGKTVWCVDASVVVHCRACDRGQKNRGLVSSFRLGCT